jgi:hypothetical protein
LKQLLWKQNKYTDNNRRYAEKKHTEPRIPIQDIAVVANRKLLRARPTPADRVQQYNKEQEPKRRRLHQPTFRSSSKASTTADQQHEEEEEVQEGTQTPSASEDICYSGAVPAAPITTTLLLDNIYQVPASILTYSVQLSLVAGGYPGAPVRVQPIQLKPSVRRYYWIIIYPKPNYCYKKQ